MRSDASVALPADARPGRVALRVGSLDRVVPFYREVVGLHRETREGNQVHLGVGGSTVLELHEAPDAPERTPTEAGLFHVAFCYPDRAALARRLNRVRDSEYDLTGASDHDVSEALYLRDPEGNGVELYRDRPREEWPHTESGEIDIDTLPLDLDDLASADEDGGAERGTDAGDDDETGAPAGTTVGHVHLEATDLGAMEEFYAEGLGLDVKARYGESVAFLAAGGYHHHLGINTWNGRTDSTSASRGLAWFEFVLPDATTLDGVTDRLEERGHAIDRGGERAFVIDPDGISLRLSTA